MIRTVLGDIERENTQNVLMHEHIQCVSSDLNYSYSKNWCDEAELENRSTEILANLKKENTLGIFVDGTPLDLGRNIHLLRAVSERSGVHIVASSGLYYYPSLLTAQRSEEDICQLLLPECLVGIQGTGIRAGILKCAVDWQGMSWDTKLRLGAVGRVQASTGLPLYMHCSHEGTLAMQSIELFESKGVNLSKVVVGHASRRLDAGYLAEILKTGAYICIDQSFDGDEEKVAKAVYALCERGYQKQLLFSHDKAIRNDFEPNCREIQPTSEIIKRYSYLQNQLIPGFKRLGIDDDTCRLFLRENSLDVLDI